MREIIYVQAGTLANYTGTHFWNTQESYLFDTTIEKSLVDLHDPEVSFREGLTQTGQPTLCPRLLVFDRKANFGTLAKTNALLGTNEDDVSDEEVAAIWNGGVAEYRQDPIQKSTYHSSLDDSDRTENSTADGANKPQIGPENVRYWSDFNRVYYVPRTVQKIPDAPEWENPDGDWNSGQEMFSRYNEDTDLMEGSLRLFLEECNSIQGIQVINDTASFGSFINSFLTAFRDEFVKLPCLVIPLLTDAGSRHIDVDDYQGTRNLISDALYLRGLSEFSSLSIPIQPPVTWDTESWSDYIASGRHNTYHNSAILSAHIETSTLPLRLKGTHESIGSISSQLDWRGGTPFGELSGVFPFTSAEDLDNRIVNFSSGQSALRGPGPTLFARRDVSRGFSPSQITGYDTWCSRLSIQDSYVSRIHAPGYPIPTSFPSFFKAPDSNRSLHPGILTRPPKTALLSSLSTTSFTAKLFSKYATSIEKCLSRKFAVESIGSDSDELKELANNLWTLHDNFSDDGGVDGNIGDDDGASLGEDE
ncbi:Misato segment II tubulin-like domain-containing protein [Collybia nuda]|uniref:Misato segment II tubulin-like domain-containing protein n=1 Tax=Collybia nuda TaxID=64659 RepID=A0A9P6CEF1_9AGAR|nr:Misato segment II tubulin-like domain-containing protein [Collybia nuda]